MDCIFCKIVKGEIPSYKIYEDEYTYAFLDIDPDSDGHTLVIPKKHFKDLDDIDLTTLSKINETTKKVKKILEDKLGCNGVIIQQNNGNIQEVKHYHVHLKPTYEGINNVEFIKHKEMLSIVEDVYNKIRG